MCSGIPLAAQVTAPCLDRPPEDRPYNRDHLLDMVKSQTPHRAEYLIRTCGVNSPLSSQLESDLRQAGADANVIAAVREVAPKPVVVEKPKPSPEGQTAQGQVRENPKEGLKYVFIPPGTFRMGCSPGDNGCSMVEKPAHEVRISKGFWMEQTDVTVEAYKRYVSAAGGSMPKPPFTNRGWKEKSVPVTMVSWNDAHGYCGWAGMRLPTEAEWEYAARARSTHQVYGDLDAIAWYSENASGRPHKVAQKLPNAFRLHDMLGNVWQWTADWYEDYTETADVDPQGPQAGDSRVLRGGSCYNNSSIVRASLRGRNAPTGSSFFLGFRCAGEIGGP
ncbi:MAG TPA: formylglycine-generating enzyme family protein [Bryobacteraceae bacterium]|jgi:formylglycine-generating enzyme required for sulfatase activity